MPVSDGAVDGGEADGGAPCACTVAPAVDVVLVVPDEAGIRTLLEQTVDAVVDEVILPLAADGANIHVGLLSGDLGVGVETVPGCSIAGNDGMLLRVPGSPSFATVDAVVTGDALKLDLRSRLALDDCGFEQPLEAFLKAIAPAGAGYDFHHGAGQSDVANSGFLRDGSTLVAIVLAVENDCSATDEGLYDPASMAYDGALERRCFEYPGALRPIERYSDATAALHDPRRVVYHVVGGVPVDLVDASAEDVLLDPRMVERIDAAFPTRLESVCSRPTIAAFYPARRQLELAVRLSENGAASGFSTLCGMSAVFPGLSDRIRATACDCAP